MSDSLKSFLGMVLFGSVFLLVGTFIVLISFDIIPVAEDSFNAPRLVVAAAGMVFVLGGMLVMVNALRHVSGVDSPVYRWLYSALIFAFIVIFAIPFNWAAFGPGERAFSSSVSVGAATSSGSSSEFSGRLVFGIAAILVDALIISMLIRLLQGKDLTK